MSGAAPERDMSDASRIRVGGADGPADYEVVIGAGVRDEVGALLEGATRVAIVHQPPLAEHAAALADTVSQSALLLPVPDGEDAKTVTVAARCWDALADAGFTRSDAVIGFGGGAATDLAGWVAASWLRGVRVVQVPTSLAGMVDAAIGGKTGVNIAQGKNLVGAFHPPSGVLCDLDLLATLPDAESRSGLAEVVKCGFSADPVILELIDADPARAARAGNPVERELVERAVQVKADVVSEDLREQGLREVLNYGHTLGHAIERAEHYRWRHGDAVAVGLVFAAALGRELGRLDAESASRHRSILDALGLPTRYRAGALDELLDTMRIDKKARGSRIRFVVLDGIARPVTVDEPDHAVLAAAYSEVS
jgi:3-dehydroquinate synthase